MTYEAFLHFEHSLAADPSSWSSDLMNAWLEHLRIFYTNGELGDDCDLLTGLKASDNLESSFLIFRRLMESLDRPTELNLLRTSRHSQPGRHYYLSQFGKDSWAPSKMSEEGGKWRLDAKTNFNIHIEPQYSVLGHDFSVYLHYETNPYHPVGWLESNVNKNDYAAYDKRRSMFADYLRFHPPSELKLGGRTNQIGKKSFSLDGLTVKSARTELARILANFTEAVDRTLEALAIYDST